MMMVNRDLIRYILKEETENIDKISKGIDIAVKMLKKDYPFIIGWEYSNEPEKYKFSIYINLEIDYKKSMEFYKTNPHPRFFKFLDDDIKRRQKYAYPFSMMDYESDEDFQAPEKNLKLTRDVKGIYSDMVPEFLKMQVDDEDAYKESPKEIAIDNYIFVK